MPNHNPVLQYCKDILRGLRSGFGPCKVHDLGDTRNDPPLGPKEIIPLGNWSGFKKPFNRHPGEAKIP